MSKEYEILFRSEKSLSQGGIGWIKSLKTTPNEDGTYYYREVGSTKNVVPGHFTIKKIIVDGKLPDNKIYFAITPVQSINGVTQTLLSTSGIIPWCITGGVGFGTRFDLQLFLETLPEQRILKDFVAITMDQL